MDENIPAAVPVAHPGATFRQPCSHRRHWQFWTLLLVILTAMTMSFTIFFAYNSSLAKPISRKLILAKPERSILVLNLASQITIFCLAELTTSVLEALRWALACTPSGVSAHTFLALGRSTNILGVLFLLFARGHKFWGSQRYSIEYQSRAHAKIVIYTDTLCVGCSSPLGYFFPIYVLSCSPDSREERRAWRCVEYHIGQLLCI